MKRINLFYWSNIRLQNWKTENYGDLLSRYLVEKISGKQVRWVHPRKLRWFQDKRHFLAVGSILAQATAHSKVWGSGIISREQQLAPAAFYAVRGPETRKRLLEQSIDCPPVYGDPALLLPRYLNMEAQKTVKTGWVPHYKDFELLKRYKLPLGNTIIDLRTNDVERTTMELLSCQRILSSSLHGLIVAHAYGIPAIWVKLSGNLFGDDIKFRDYFLSVGIDPYEGHILGDINETPSQSLWTLNEGDIDTIFNASDPARHLPEKAKIIRIQDDLLAVCPFKT